MTPPPPTAAAAVPAVASPPRAAGARATPTPPSACIGPRQVRVPRRRPRAGPCGRRNPATIVTTHPLFDRLIHGRAWIGLVAFALIGIVTMQLGLLKLNAGIGRALEHEGALQRENSALSVENSEVAAGDTVELQATHMGMQLIPAGTLKFLAASPAYIDRAVSALNTPVSAPPSTEAESSATSTETTSETRPEATSSAAPTETTESTSTPTTSESTPTSESGGASPTPGG